MVNYSNITVNSLVFLKDDFQRFGIVTKMREPINGYIKCRVLWFTKEKKETYEVSLTELQLLS